jgi:hypothetical protein
MGLRFSNEVIVAAEQIYPSSTEVASTRRSSNLVNSQGFVAVPFVVDMGTTAPPSIRLVPCRPYLGASIGKLTFFQSTKSVQLNFLPRFFLQLLYCLQNTYGI